MTVSDEEWCRRLVAECVAGRYPENVTDLLPSGSSKRVQAWARADLRALGRWVALTDSGCMSIYDLEPDVREMVEQYGCTIRAKHDRETRTPVRKRRY